MYRPQNIFHTQTDMSNRHEVWILFSFYVHSLNFKLPELFNLQDGELCLTYGEITPSLNNQGGNITDEQTDGQTDQPTI